MRFFASRFSLFVPFVFLVTLSLSHDDMDNGWVHYGYEAPKPFRRLACKSDNNLMFDMDDGSQWRVRQYSLFVTDVSPSSIVYGWCVGDELLLSLSMEYSIFGGDKKFVVQNMVDDTYVFVDLVLGADLNNPLSVRVRDIDVTNSEVLLSRGYDESAAWNVYHGDKRKLREWKVEDTIIVGCNQGLVSRWFYPYVLLNVEINDFVLANLL